MSNTNDTGIGSALNELRPKLKEYKDHLQALQNGESFIPVLNGKNAGKKSKKDEGETRGKKRKNTREGGRGSPKRRRGYSSDDDDDDFIVDDDDELMFSDEDEDRASETGKGSDEDDSDRSDDDEDNDKESSDEEEEVTEESLKEKIEAAENDLKEGRVQLSEQRRLRKEAMDALATIKKRQVKAQREKNAFCSLKRSEASFLRCEGRPLITDGTFTVLSRRLEGRLPCRSQGLRW